MSVIRAIEIAGGMRALANKVGVSYQAVQKWAATRAPVERCAAIECATEGAVSKSDLRPDIWPPEPTQQPAAQKVA